MEPFKAIEASSLTLDQLLDAVEREHVCVHVLRDGAPIAEVRPVDRPGHWRLPAVVEELKPAISRPDAVAPLDEDDWPADTR